VSFIFDPDRVSRLLECLPSLAARLPAPVDEGVPSKAFAGRRISERALYRLLTNPHYPHLREALRAIEAAAAAGMSLKELREARLRGEFGSLLAEVLLADHFLSRDLAVSKRSSRGGKNPDLEVGAEGLAATIEVYSPRSWHWREDWIDDVRDAVKNADIPYAYTATVDIAVNESPVHADLLEDMILRTGQDVLRRVREDLAGLDESATATKRDYEHTGSEMITTIEFAHVEPEAIEVVRLIGIGGPGDSFSAEVEFSDLITKIREKAEKHQAADGDGTVRGLTVDVSRTGLDYLLETGRLTFDASSGLDLDALELDLIALTTPRRGRGGPRRGVRAAVLFEDSRVTPDQIALLFDARR
jgi:hypothetical protein